jgi:hypothetical protein
LNSSLAHTHLCEKLYGELFCGAVGVLTLSVRFVSVDSVTSTSSSYRFGGHIAVVDVIAGNFYGKAADWWSH